MATEIEVNKNNDAISGSNLKPHKTEQWEIDTIGEFLFELYKQQIISAGNNWLIQKQKLRNEFQQFLKKPGNDGLEEKFQELCGKADIGSLLYRTGYLVNTQRGSNMFRIRYSALNDYCHSAIEKYDIKHRNVIGGGVDLLPELVEVKNDDHGGTYSLSYKGSELQVCKQNYLSNKLGCYICQLNFDSEEQLSEHITFHGEESNFASLTQLKKFDTSVWKISYKPCKNSHYLYFTLKTKMPEVLIEKIVVVQSRSLHFINNEKVPYKTNEGSASFYVNSQLFTAYVEQPVIIVFHTGGSEDMRFMEQHHIMCTAPFPIVQMGINTERIPYERVFESSVPLDDYTPSNELQKSLKNDFPTEYLIKISPEFYEYMANVQVVSTKTMYAVMKMLLQIEDLSIKRANYLLLQREVVIRECKGIYSMPWKYLTWSSEIVKSHLQNFPKIGDEIMFLPETDESKALKNSTILDLLIEKDCEHLIAVLSQLYGICIGTIKNISNGNVQFISSDNIPITEKFIAIVRPSRRFLCYQYRALEMIKSMSEEKITRCIFPQPVETTSLLPSHNLVLQNKGIGNDPEQLQAVRNIINHSDLDVPYIIIGGPGSGKTAVIVEAIFQLYLRNNEAKILVTAGTDSACDEIALRLCKVLCNMHDERAIARIYSNTSEQQRKKIDELLLEYSNLYAEHYFLPAIDVLKEFRVLVCTVEMVGQLSSGQSLENTKSEENLIFSHIFIEDAAALTEPETLVVFADVLAKQSTIILSGDPKQLDAPLHSKRVKSLGLGFSLFERLILRECYGIESDGNYNKAIVSSLLRNYRGHPQIVNLYNHLYYNNKIIPSASNDVTSFCEKWHRMPNPDFPIIFHNVEAPGQSTFNCTSNSDEVSVVMRYVKELMYIGINGRKVAQQDIGIITPYKKQAICIQEELNLRGWYRIDVGSPESFQGKEKFIMIVSFVWSTPNSLDILNNSRRLNFMISRAKAMLILVGNADILKQQDELKFIIMESCRNNTFENGKVLESAPETPEASNVQAGKKSQQKQQQKEEKQIKNKDEGKPQTGAIEKTYPPNQKNKKKPKKIQNNENDNETDDFLDSLPSVPSNDIVKSLESEVHERLRNLNLRSSATTPTKLAAKENNDFVFVEKPTTSSTANANAPVKQFDKKHKQPKPTPQQQKKLQEHLQQDNIASGGQVHVKRLNNNQPNRRQNNPGATKNNTAGVNKGNTKANNAAGPKNKQNKPQQQQQQQMQANIQSSQAPNNTLNTNVNVVKAVPRGTLPAQTLQHSPNNSPQHASHSNHPQQQSRPYPQQQRSNNPQQSRPYPQQQQHTINPNGPNQTNSQRPWYPPVQQQVYPELRTYQLLEDGIQRINRQQQQQQQRQRKKKEEPCSIA